VCKKYCILQADNLQVDNLQESANSSHSVNFDVQNSTSGESYGFIYNYIITSLEVASATFNFEQKCYAGILLDENRRNLSRFCVFYCLNALRTVSKCVLYIVLFSSYNACF
jgi:hypothetical protein